MDLKSEILKEIKNYLELEFNAIFKLEENHDDSNPFNTCKIKVFKDEKYITMLTHPLELYNDISYMFGTYKDNDFYRDNIESLNLKVPSKFANSHDFAMNEIKCLYKEIISKNI